jgi:hypothetical protein
MGVRVLRLIVETVLLFSRHRDVPVNWPKPADFGRHGVAP